MQNAATSCKYDWQFVRFVSKLWYLRLSREPGLLNSLKELMGIQLKLILALILIVPGVAAAQEKANEIDFNRQIRPILSNNCYACHGPDEEARAADLRLDTHEGATDFAIDVDYPEESELLLRIAATDPIEVMPPPKHGKPLSEDDQKLLLQWIQEGAKYAKHWSYESPKKSPVPEVESGSIVNPIDNFILSKLEGTGLKPSPSADRLTLIRRLALDVTGLPPTLEEVDRFLADQSENAYEKLVDYYLAKPAYGERWAAVWLDLARYADSAGFAEDKTRTIWAYRDYVIRSYNQNKSFEQFTLEQIAGDLLPNVNDETKIATAFHRNTLTNSEGGTSDEEFRSAAVVDRVNTTMAVWMGTTMACAQCHTHKYDPITQKEYFQFYDFLNHTADNDRPNEAPVLPIYSESAIAKRQQIQFDIADLQAELNTPAKESDFSEWLVKTRLNADNHVQGQFVRVELSGDNRILSLAEVQVFSSTSNYEQKNVAINGKATQSSTAYEGPPEYAIDNNTSGNFNEKTVTHTATEKSPWWQVDLGGEHRIEKISLWHRDQLHQRSDGFTVSILDQDKQVVWSKTYAKALPQEQVVELPTLPESVQKLLAQETLDAAQRQELEKFYVGVRNSGIRAKIAGLESELNSISAMTTVPIMVALPSKQKRVTQIQIRGNYLDTGETVAAATPAALHPLPEDAPTNRLTLARWLVDQNNPLTARVLVNRYWEQIFGIGIVQSSEEFGAQGDLPSHPELLDWLATDLMENDWDTKRLVKQLVMSATYRQSSSVDAESLEIDPNNRLLARGPRIRLSAEMIRDQALAVSGLLSKKMYGPPVQPPQPKIGLKPAFTSKTTDWTDSVGEDRYRRGIYTEWRRSSPYPSMATFDVNSREVCEIRRSNTNTPLQALVTLNDPVYVEAAQALARRVTSTDNPTPRAIAEKAFRLCLIRKPSDKELDRIVSLFENTRKHFADDPESAKRLAVDPLHPLSPETDFIELAAWTTVANVLLNLDEMLMKP